MSTVIVRPVTPNVIVQHSPQPVLARVGIPGLNGREVEMRTNAGTVQWRYVGDTDWTDLYAIPSGSGGGASAELYTPSVPSATWVYNHSLGRRPEVAVYVGNSLYLADVTATSTTVTVEFPTATTGQLVLT